MATIDSKISVFISYSTFDKEIAGRIKDVLSEFNIEVFLAHEDIEISEEWKNVILQKIYECNVFIALLSNNFKKSDWTSQEIGVVIGKRDNTLILPLKVDTIPYGFIASIQGGNLGEKTGWTYPGINELIKRISLKFPALMFDKLLSYLATSASWRDAEGRLKFVLGSLQNPLSASMINRILEVSASNSEIWWASGNIEWISSQLMNNKEIDKEIVDKFRSLEPYRESLELFN